MVPPSLWRLWRPIVPQPHRPHNDVAAGTSSRSFTISSPPLHHYTPPLLHFSTSPLHLSCPVESTSLHMATLMQQAMADKAVKWITLGWVGFISENLIISDNREWIIEHYGSKNYHMAYSALSTLTSGSILYGYIRYGRGKGPKLPVPSSVRMAASFVFTSLGLVGLSQYAPLIRMPYTYDKAETPESQLPSNGMKKSALQQQSEAKADGKVWRCPMDFRPKDAKVTEDGIQGMERISRHSMFWSLGSLAMGKALSTVFLPEMIMFSFPMAFAYIGGAHQDMRFRRGSGGTLTDDKYNKTSNVPFFALVTGKQSWATLSSEMKYSNMSIALATSALLALRKFRL